MCDSCPYNTDKMRCDLATLYQDALELLIATEPVKTKHNNGVTHWYVAAECDVTVNPGDKFCRECGRRLVWDDAE